VQRDFYFTRDSTGIEEMSPAVANALRTVPRHRFVDETQRSAAYIDAPLPIGHGQTISQPYIVALMTELLMAGSESVILEVGSGSGYQAAVLSRIVRDVYTIEIIAALGMEAAARWQELGYTNIHGCIGDGSRGWPEHAPYDGIVVTAAAEEIPAALIDQLKPGGHLVIPVGHFIGGQELMVITKDVYGAVHNRTILPVAFVPLVHARS
jgi:protein-L-isoaspartate(D-aspartate) O-methyltransferase